jgi:hypothetical protein
LATRADGLGEIAKRLDDLARRVEATPGDGGDEHGLSALGQDGVDVSLQSGRVGGERADPLPFFLLVVMAELDEDEVARAELREDFVEPTLALE